MKKIVKNDLTPDSPHSKGGAMNQQDHTTDTEPRPANSPRTAFVTGATGFVGLNLIGQLTPAPIPSPRSSALMT
jgi:hypothetical protein